ncbi:hypothetical protein J5500_03525 [Candidatus Saccharibacteria bacterium]|nr:hypothetical protein [Candidatus Saccharibacteria bacterium]
MEEKGGDSNNESKNISTNYVNSKIVSWVAIIVILGAAFITAMICIGINISNQREEPTPEQPVDDPDHPVIESIKVEYDETSMSYAAPKERSNEYKNSLMHRYGVDDAEYAIIRSSSELDDFITAVNHLSDGNDATNPFTYSVSEDFFKTGVIVAVAKEEPGLASMRIDDVYRNQNYNLQIYAHYASPYDTLTVFGMFSLIQIQNIQPKAVEVFWNSSANNDPNERPDYPVTEKKPIVYLYPTRTTSVDVKLSNPERITTDYPDYKNGWSVVAEPDGTLTTRAGKKLYALYYESKNVKKYTEADLKEGFVVAKDDVEEFLDQKLKTLGLNYKEREEFISYWAGELESKPYAFIRFQTAAEIEQNMGLQVTPKPDTVIRVMMEYKLLNQPIKVKAQKLQSVERKGFTVVEWGGTEVKL